MKKVKSFIKKSNIKSFILGIAIAILISFGVTAVLAVSSDQDGGGMSTGGITTKTYGFIGQNVGLVNKIGSLTIGKNTDDDWIMDTSNKCLTQGDGIELQTCLSVVGSASFSKLTVLDMPAFIQNSSLFLNESGDQSFLAGLPRGLVIDDFAGDDDSIMVSSLQYEVDGNLAPRNLDEQRNLCSDSNGKLYVCAEPTYHWEVNTNDWTSCELNQQGSCSGGTYTDTSYCSGGTYTGMCTGDDGYAFLEKINWNGVQSNWIYGDVVKDDNDCNSNGNKCSWWMVGNRTFNYDWAILVHLLSGDPVSAILMGLLHADREKVWKHSQIRRRRKPNGSLFVASNRPLFNASNGECSDLYEEDKCINPGLNHYVYKIDNNCSWIDGGECSDLSEDECTSSSECTFNTGTVHNCSNINNKYFCVNAGDSNECTWNFPTGIQHNTYICKDDSGNTVDDIYCSDLTKSGAGTRSCKVDGVCGDREEGAVLTTYCESGVCDYNGSGCEYCMALSEDNCSTPDSDCVGSDAGCAG